MESQRDLAYDTTRTEASELLSADEGEKMPSAIRRGSLAFTVTSLLLAFVAGATGGAWLWNNHLVGQRDVQAKANTNQAAKVDVDGAIEFEAPSPTPTSTESGCPKPNTLFNGPPKGSMWRGSTNLPNPQDYQNWFGSALNVWRIFTTSPLTDTELDFVSGGGILFVSPQPTNWSAELVSPPTELMEKTVNIVKSVAPALVYVAFGFEPDGHANETANSPGEVFGTASEWVAMQQKFGDYMKSMGVTNAKQVIDFSTDMPMEFQPAATILWPGNEYVDMLCMNIFQNESTTSCETAFELVYNQFEQAATAELNYTGVPWCLGAWGTMYQNHHMPTPEPIPMPDRAECFSGMETALNSGKYSRVILENYFNSNACIVQPNGSTLNPSDAFNSPQLVQPYASFLKSAVFTSQCQTEV